MRQEYKQEIKHYILFFTLVFIAGIFLKALDGGNNITYQGFIKKYDGSLVKIAEAASITATPTPELSAIADSGVEFKDPRKVFTCKEAIEFVFENEEERAQALKVSTCESGLRKTAKNSHSTAKSCFQILDGTWKQFKCDGNRFDPLAETLCAKKIYDYYGVWNTSGGWAASYHCHNQI